MPDAQNQIEAIKNMMLDAEQGDLQAVQQVMQIALSVQDPQQREALMQIAQHAPAPQVLQMLQQMFDGTPSMKRGGIVNYLKFLRGECPEGYLMLIFKAGGKATCKKCVKMKQEGDTIDPQEDVITQYKKGCKMKKKACGGNLKQKKKDK